jgi:hypothetical protein
MRRQALSDGFAIRKQVVEEVADGIPSQGLVTGVWQR